MKKYDVYSLLVVLALTAAFTSAAFAQLDAGYKQQILNATAADEPLLIQALEKGGQTPEDIFRMNLACKRLAVVGTDAAIPALVKLLGDEKQSFNARFALEAMKGKNVDAALFKAAKELKGALGAGVIATIGNRRTAEAVPLLKDLLAAGPDPLVKKAIFAALGFIATDDASNVLLAELKAGKKDNNYTVWAGLGDALLDCAEAAQKAGNADRAGTLYDAIVNPSFPVATQKAAAYHGLLVRGPASASVLIEKMESPKKCCFSGGLKSIREFCPKSSEAIVKALIAELPKLPNDRKVLVIRALGDRCDDVSRQLVLPALAEQGKSGTPEVKVAVLQAFGKAAQKNPSAFLDFLAATKLCTAGEPYADAFVATMVALPGKEVCAAVIKAFNERSVTDAFLKPQSEQGVVVAKALLSVVELRRIADLAPGLVKVVNTPGVNDAVRDGALAALSEIVTLDKLNLLVKALDNEKNEEKVDWILRAACTRLPREDCAAAVVKIFDAATTEEKVKMMGLIKQIGGKTAVRCIADACWKSETVDEATKVLGQWNTPDDIDDIAAACLKLAKEGTDNKYCVRGIRSYIRIPRQFNMPLDKRIAMCKTAFDTAVRPEDKALIFDVLARQTEFGAVKAALSYTKEKAYKERACEVAVDIANKINVKPKTGTAKAIVGAMGEVQKLTGEDKIKDSAQKVIDKLK